MIFFYGYRGKVIISVDIFFDELGMGKWYFFFIEIIFLEFFFHVGHDLGGYLSNHQILEEESNKDYSENKVEYPPDILGKNGFEK